MPAFNILTDPGVTGAEIVVAKQASKDVCITLRNAFDAADGS
jgi:hypothetical protein